MSSRQSVIDIGDRSVGPGRPCFVVAEIGINHNGDLDIVKRLVDAAVAAGCDAVKLQKRTVEALGIRRLHQKVSHEDRPQIRGMIRRVAHLVEVREIESP